VQPLHHRKPLHCLALKTAAFSVLFSFSVSTAFTYSDVPSVLDALEKEPMSFLEIKKTGNLLAPDQILRLNELSASGEMKSELRTSLAVSQVVSPHDSGVLDIHLERTRDIVLRRIAERIPAGKLPSTLQSINDYIAELKRMDNDALLGEINSVLNDLNNNSYISEFDYRKFIIFSRLGRLSTVDRIVAIDLLAEVYAYRTAGFIVFYFDPRSGKHVSENDSMIQETNRKKNITEWLHKELEDQDAEWVMRQAALYRARLESLEEDALRQVAVIKMTMQNDGTGETIDQLKGFLSVQDENVLWALVDYAGTLSPEDRTLMIDLLTEAFIKRFVVLEFEDVALSGTRAELRNESLPLPETAIEGPHEFFEKVIKPMILDDSRQIVRVQLNYRDGFIELQTKDLHDQIPTTQHLHAPVAEARTAFQNIKTVAQISDTSFSERAPSIGYIIVEGLGPVLVTVHIRPDPASPLEEQILLTIGEVRGKGERARRSELREETAQGMLHVRLTKDETKTKVDKAGQTWNWYEIQWGDHFTEQAVTDLLWKAGLDARGRNHWSAGYGIFVLELAAEEPSYALVIKSSNQEKYRLFRLNMPVEPLQAFVNEFQLRAWADTFFLEEAPLVNVQNEPDIEIESAEMHAVSKGESFGDHQLSITLPKEAGFQVFFTNQRHVDSLSRPPDPFQSIFEVLIPDAVSSNVHAISGFLEKLETHSPQSQLDMIHTSGGSFFLIMGERKGSEKTPEVIGLAFLPSEEFIGEKLQRFQIIDFSGQPEIYKTWVNRHFRGSGKLLAEKLLKERVHFAQVETKVRKNNAATFVAFKPIVQEATPTQSSASTFDQKEFKLRAASKTAQSTTYSGEWDEYALDMTDPHALRALAYLSRLFSGGIPKGLRHYRMNVIVSQNKGEEAKVIGLAVFDPDRVAQTLSLFVFPGMDSKKLQSYGRYVYGAALPSYSLESRYLFPLATLSARVLDDGLGPVLLTISDIGSLSEMEYGSIDLLSNLLGIEEDETELEEAPVPAKDPMQELKEALASEQATGAPVVLRAKIKDLYYSSPEHRAADGLAVSYKGIESVIMRSGLPAAPEEIFGEENELDVFVTAVPEEGPPFLTAVHPKAYRELEEAERDPKRIFNIRINKMVVHKRIDGNRVAGFEVSYNGLRGFLPYGKRPKLYGRAADWTSERLEQVVVDQFFPAKLVELKFRRGSSNQNVREPIFSVSDAERLISKEALEELKEGRENPNKTFEILVLRVMTKKNERTERPSQYRYYDRPAQEKAIGLEVYYKGLRGFVPLRLALREVVGEGDRPVLINNLMVGKTFRATLHALDRRREGLEPTFSILDAEEPDRVQSTPFEVKKPAPEVTAAAIQELEEALSIGQTFRSRQAMLAMRETERYLSRFEPRRDYDDPLGFEDSMGLGYGHEPLRDDRYERESIGGGDVEPEPVFPVTVTRVIIKLQTANEGNVVGFEVDYKGVRGFVPVRFGPGIAEDSRNLALRERLALLEEHMLGKEFPATVTELEESRRGRGQEAKFSIREGERARLKKGQKVQVRVTREAYSFGGDFGFLRRQRSETMSGLEVDVAGVRGFVPFSHLRPEIIKALRENYSQVIGQTFEAAIIDVKHYRGEMSLVLSFLDDPSQAQKALAENRSIDRRAAIQALQDQKDQPLNVTVQSVTSKGNGLNVVTAEGLRGFIYIANVLVDDKSVSSERELEGMAGYELTVYVKRIDLDREFVEFTMWEPGTQRHRGTSRGKEAAYGTWSSSARSSGAVSSGSSGIDPWIEKKLNEKKAAGQVGSAGNDGIGRARGIGFPEIRKPPKPRKKKKRSELRHFQNLLPAAFLSLSQVTALPAEQAVTDLMNVLHQQAQTAQTETRTDLVTHVFQLNPSADESNIGNIFTPQLVFGESLGLALEPLAKIIPGYLVIITPIQADRMMVEAVAGHFPDHKIMTAKSYEEARSELRSLGVGTIRLFASERDRPMDFLLKRVADEIVYIDNVLSFVRDFLGVVAANLIQQFQNARELAVRA